MVLEEYVFYAKINGEYNLNKNKGTMIKTLFDILKDILKGKIVHILVTNNNILIKTPNNDKGELFLYVSINGNELDEFYCSEEYNDENYLEIPINSNELNKCTKSIQAKDLIEFYIRKDDRYNFIIRRKNELNCITQYKLKLDLIKYNTEYKYFNISNLLNNEDSSEYKTICLKSEQFHKIIKEYKEISEIDKRKDNIELIYTDNTLTFLGDNRKKCRYENIITLSENVEYIIQGRYYVQYLLIVSKMRDLNKELHLYLANDFPLIIKYNIEYNLGELYFILAQN